MSGDDQVADRVGDLLARRDAFRNPWTFSIDGSFFKSIRIVFVRTLRNLRIRSLNCGPVDGSTPGAIA